MTLICGCHTLGCLKQTSAHKFVRLDTVNAFCTHASVATDVSVLVKTSPDNVDATIVVCIVKYMQ